MKKLKTILGFLAVLLIAVVAAWNVNVNSQTKGMSDLRLANVEALAQETFPWGCLVYLLNECMEIVVTPDYSYIQYVTGRN